MIVNFFERGFLFAFVQFKLFPAFLKLGQFDLFFILFFHEEMQGFGLLELFDEMLEFLILLIPLLLFQAHDL